MLFLFFVVLRVAGQAEKPALLLVSIDGFRWDYFEKSGTPHLRALASEGVQAEALIPVFPSLTFPNHYSIVTGLYPTHHGIIGNVMYNPESKRTFTFRNRESIHDPSWWLGEPIWITAMKQGQVAATCFWPGTDVEIAGVRPTHWLPFDGNKPNRDRIKQILEWLALPESERPTLLTLYFGDVDKMGHHHGPESPEVLAAIEETDRLIGELVHALKAQQHWDRLNMIVVSDHGMTGISRDRVVFLDDYISLADVQVIDWTPIVSMIPKEGKEEHVARKLADTPHAKFYRPGQFPARFRYRNSTRIAPITGVPDEGWLITNRQRVDGLASLKGMHGYDNELPSMHGIFIARGPAFKQGLITKPFLNIHLYNLMARVLQLRPAPNDGDLNAVKELLRLEIPSENPR